MPVDVSCQCGQRFRAGDQLAGKMLPCPRCGLALTIPFLTGPAQPTRTAFDGPALPATASEARWAAWTTPEPAQAPAGRLGYDFARGRPIWHVFLGAAISVGGLLLGVLLTGIACVQTQQAADSAAWPETVGLITESKVTSRGIRRRTHTLYFSYDYTVNGQRFTGHYIAVGDALGGDPRLTVLKYREGDQHPVYYNPANPSDAVLEKGVRGATIGWIVGAAATGITGLLGCVVFGLTILSRLT